MTILGGLMLCAVIYVLIPDPPKSYSTWDKQKLIEYLMKQRGLK